METLLIVLALAAAFWCGLWVESWCSRQIAVKDANEGRYWHKMFLDLQKQYFDLIWEVHTKWPGETRHQIAKRYIMEQERGIDAVTRERNLNG